MTRRELLAAGVAAVLVLAALALPGDRADAGLPRPAAPAPIATAALSPPPAPPAAHPTPAALDTGPDAASPEQAPLDLGALLGLYAWPVDEALKIAGCETGGTFDPTLESDGNLGLFQIHYASHAARVETREELFDPAINVRVAFDVWRDNAGWRGPWAGCFHALANNS